MSPIEIRAAVSLAVIMFMRMMGLFMLLPVLALHLREFQGSTPLLIGLAVGGYGISQALLQIPFGALSDRYGRKPVIATGLLIFAFGSVLAGASGTIAGVIAGLGRAAGEFLRFALAVGRAPAMPGYMPTLARGFEPIRCYLSRQKLASRPTSSQL